MTKKRQQDFPKTQLKPGRMISGRKNITAPAVKYKKLVKPKEKPVKLKSEFTIRDYVQKIKSGYSDKDKVAYLNELNKLIPRHSETINTYLCEIFETVLDFIRDTHDGIRNAALKVVGSVLVNTDDLQLHSFVDLLNNNISAMMKSPNQKIAPASLILLESMLKNHPDLICHNINILIDLLPSERKHYTRKYTEKEVYQYSEKGDIAAFRHINAFLQNILKKKNYIAKSEDEDDKVVHMDYNETLYLQLYAGGGLKPIDINKAFLKQFGQQINPLEENEKLEPIIHALLKLIRDYFCHIVGIESSTDDNMFKPELIADLSVLIELLCSVSELAEKISYDDAKDEIAAFLKEWVFSSRRKPFPFAMQISFPSTSSLHLAVLNNSLCFLYMKYLSSNEEFENMELLERWLSRFFDSEKIYPIDVKFKSIPLLIKMVQLYENTREVPKIFYQIILHFISLLKFQKNHANKKMLVDLLFKMSLLPGYKFWVESEPMELWYKWLLSHLKEHPNKLDKELIKMILKVAKVRHISFMKNLDFSLIKPLLKHRNDDFKEAGIYLLHNMDISHELLKNVYDIVIKDTFPKKLTVKLIRMLYVRFSQYPDDEKPYVDFIGFLFNMALDVHNFSNPKMLDFDDNQYTKALEPLQQEYFFIVLPSLHWKEHSKVFEVCLNLLRNLPLKVVDLVLTALLKELMNGISLIPIHCALSLLKLGSLGISNKYYKSYIGEVNVSCLLTTSVLTQMTMDDEWHKWNVGELMKNMIFTRRSVVDFLQLVREDKYGKVDGIVTYHILRVLNVFASKNVLNMTCRDTLKFVLESISLAAENCSDETMTRQPLYMELYNHFLNHYRVALGR